MRTRRGARSGDCLRATDSQGRRRDHRAADFDPLRACRFSASKIATIKAIARGTVEGLILTRDSAATMDDEALIERIIGIKGIGCWTVEMLLIYSRERTDVLSVDDFDMLASIDSATEIMAKGAVLLRGAALTDVKNLLAALGDMISRSPFRHMVTPGGVTMWVAITNCGTSGWVTDRTGYRYDCYDPKTGCVRPLRERAIRISVLTPA